MIVLYVAWAETVVYVPASPPPGQVVPQPTMLMPEPVAQPQKVTGEGDAVTAEEFVALITALEIAFASKPCTMAYWTPACAASSTCILRFFFNDTATTE